MTLHKKTVLIVGSTLIGLVVILFVTSRIIIMRSFSKLEEKYTRLNILRVQTSISDNLAYLTRSANDWAAWEETYAFINNSNNNFIKVNVVDSSFTTLRLNVMLFINSSGRVVLGRAFDLEDKKVVPVPQSLLDHLAPDSILLKHTQAESHISGIILLSEGPMLISSQPILTSEGQGPIRGTLIFGRYLKDTEDLQLSGADALTIDIHGFNDKDVSRDFLHSVKSALSDEKPFLVRPVNTETIEGYTMLKDIFGKPALVVRVAMNRDIYKEGQNIFYYFILSFLLIGLVLSIVTLILLEEQVLSRVTSLIQNIGVIGASGDLSKRVQMKGKDEISLLSDEMNRMLETIEHSDKALRESEEKYRLIVENANEAIVIVQEAKLQFVNPKTAEIMGYTQKDLIYADFLEFVHPEDQALVAERYRKRLMDEDVPSVYSFRIIDIYGNVKWVEINAVKTQWMGKEATLNFINDITERKELEEELRVMSLRDVLTGLYNRRGFLTLAEQQLKIASRMQKGMLMIFADLDGMKQINDDLGHQEGDRALIDIAQILKKTFRESDIIARHGGDEFVILSLETPEFGADLLVNRLAEHMHYHNRYESRPYSLSLSMGFARYDPEKPMSLHELLVKADSMMYEEKKSRKSSKV
jgi:diguanylate cyclase (GGDEF)-like protein/PAS domain S-box-containing protein